MSTIYGYTRVSTERQADSGLSLDAQEAAIKGRITELSQVHSAKPGRVYRDGGVSATKIPFRARPKGGELFKRAKRGDHIVIAKLDRGFRSVKDCLLTLEDLQRRGVTVHLMDMQIDTSSTVGQLLIGILSTIAQWEATRIGDRIRDAFGRRREVDPTVTLNGARVIGYSLADGKYSPHHEERAAGALAADLRAQGKSLPEIVESLSGRFQRPNGRTWTVQAVKRLIERHRSGWPIHPYATRKDVHAKSHE